MKIASIRCTTEVGGRKVALRERYGGRSAGHFVAMAIAAVFDVFIAVKMLEAPSVQRSGMNAVATVVVVVVAGGVLAFAFLKPMMKPKVLQVDDVGISYGAEAFVWGEVALIAARYMLVYRGYQLQVQLHGSGIKRLLSIDHALGEGEFEELARFIHEVAPAVEMVMAGGCMRRWQG
ncbi:MAG TPA: hypothetical protein VHQ47_15840 [Phycisphaerae bacterium]|nr:hypothetical protein [Phycisphaerae bacterium]